ncbi:AAA family ATPase [Ferruginibacter sp. HRS2-29]|nr:AAA family ATPase [Ferruginibacter sp. HRS2-29]
MPLVKRGLERLRGLFRQRRDASVFDHYYVDAKAMYMQEYNSIPNISYISGLDMKQVFDHINNGHAGTVLAVWQRNQFNWQATGQEFTSTIFKLENKVLIRIGYDNAEIFYGYNRYEYTKNLVEALARFRQPEKEQPFEMNIITANQHGLELKQLQIKPTVLDIGLYYNDDFAAVDKVIRERLMKENDKGIILLHGLPGTGKTTYLRHLIGGLKKKVLFVSPGVAGNLVNPDFIDLLIDNPNAVLIIEDAENIIMDRKLTSSSTVSNLLNISDGLLSDCLNVQIICTFNSELNMVDSALLRKVRLIAKYEFGKLGINKSQKLSDHLGFKTVVNEPMTLAAIANQHEADLQPESRGQIGFRRNVTS